MDKVADIEVDKVADIVADMVAAMEVEKMADIMCIMPKMFLKEVYRAKSV